jgi:hypothetical protein
MSALPLFAADPSALAPKAAALVRLAAAGLPVPPGLVLPLGARGTTRWADTWPPSELAALLASGPVIVRSALALEDGDAHAGAGLGLSIAGCTDEAAVRAALLRVAEHRDDPLVASASSPDGAGDLAIVQHEVPRALLLAVADHPDGVDVEVHAAGGDALGGGATPIWAGSLATWAHPAARRALELVRAVAGVLGPTAHGRELELVVDPEGEVHVVQARPFVAPVHPGAAEFLAEVRARDPHVDLSGRLVLDAEHNPAPLSPAHAWLMRHLAASRPRAGDPTVLAGWLYVRVLPRALGSALPPPGPSVREVLDTLAHDRLPAARARLEAIERATASGDAHAIAAALTPALDAFLAMIDVYLGELVPARSRARAEGLRPIADVAAPLTLSARDEFLDVLPAAWDIASPSLAELGVAARGGPAPRVEGDAEAATLLGEWDDHLFALGLSPLRCVMRRGGAALGLGDDAFLLTPPELVHALLHRVGDLEATIATRRAEAARASGLRPPLCLEDGRPVATSALGRLRGLGIGPTVEGIVAPRRDLEDLLARPPGPDAIVTLPALTAPAAVALHRANVRAVCCEHGGALSHATLMARELQLSALVGCRGCTEVPAGTRARVDTVTGRLRLLSRGSG